MTEVHRRVQRLRWGPRLVGALVALLVVLGPAPAALGRTATLGGAPSTRPVRHFQSGGFQRLRWSSVDGATSYQVFVKTADYDEWLPHEWTLLKTVHGTSTTVFVARGQTRQFGVRAVGSPVGSAYQVTPVADFGTVSRSPRVSTLAGAGRWGVVRDPALYRGMALETRTPGRSLRLRWAKGTFAVRLVGESGPRYGAVAVYLGRTFLRRVDFGHRRHHARLRVSIRVHPARRGTIRVVTRSRRPVRISAVGQTRARTHATTQPPAPVAYPPATSFTFTGSGWGHGVGLSQYGAEAMAENGYSTAQIIEHYYTGVAIGAWNDTSPVDVNVGYHRLSTTARLRALQDGASMQVCAMSADTCVKQVVVHDATADADTSGRVTLLRFDGKVRARVRDENGDVRRVTGDRVRIRWSGTTYLAGPAAVVRLGDGREYRHGQLVVHPYGTDRLNDVVHEQLEQYLLGVAEMPSSWQPAALRAQAIIARTYALKDGATLRSGCACNLRDSVVDQSYTGWAKESQGVDGYYGQRWADAVQSTAGQVVTYGGGLAATYYFSSSGGHTLNSQDVWSSQVPYLQSVDDPWSLTSQNPYRSWTATLSQARVARIFHVDAVHSLRITARYQGDAMESVTAVDQDGQPHTITGKADYLRGLFGLRSDFVTSIGESYS